jgi:hypothetical protein
MLWIENEPIMPSVVMLNVAMMSVVAPFKSALFFSLASVLAELVAIMSLLIN